jgi:hypothetical protein
MILYISEISTEAYLCMPRVVLDIPQKSDDGSYNSERDHLSRVSSAHRWVRPYRR